MSKSLIILLVFFVFSCNKPKKYSFSKKEKEILTATIDSMYKLDQGIRSKMSDLDSVYGLNSNPYEALNNNVYRFKNDSLWDIAHKIDEENTKKLIEITKTYGFPNNKRLGVYKSKAYLIFVHSPKEYFSVIDSLITEEFEQNRISEYKKEYIFWHTRGRNGMPPMAGKKDEVIFLDF